MEITNGRLIFCVAASPTWLTSNLILHSPRECFFITFDCSQLKPATRNTSHFSTWLNTKERDIPTRIPKQKFSNYNLRLIYRTSLVVGNIFLSYTELRTVTTLRTPITTFEVLAFDNKGKTRNEEQDVLKILSQSTYLFTWAGHSGLP